VRLRAHDDHAAPGGSHEPQEEAHELEVTQVSHGERALDPDPGAFERRAVHAGVGHEGVEAP
jgi:hypothetical protein